MNKTVLQDAIHLTQECLTRYWQLDCEFALGLCDDDVTWVGSLQSQFMEGIDAVTQDLRASMRELKPCHLVAQEFIVAQNCGNACTVTGRYLTTTDDEVEYFLQVQQRCTFVWEKTDSALKVKHMHVSNPMGELKVAEGEMFVNALGEHAYRYLVDHARSKKDTRRLVVADDEGRTFFLALSEIVSVAARGRHCAIRTTQGREIRARIGIAEFAEFAGERFASVHRSYSVNSAYVSCVQRYEVVMLDGSVVPIPQKRYREVRETLMALHDGRVKGADR